MYRYDNYDQTLVNERAAQFRDQVNRRVAGELSDDEFKPLRLMNGLYLQLHAYMLRIAIPYGTLSSKQLRTLAHIARHGSGLAEAIVTADHGRAMRFLREVDAGAVFVNASTRFTDGGEFGMGAEMGISTQKIHARGPMGPVELTCQKFVVLGDGQTRDSRA